MRAIFQIIANAQDITDLIKDRLISLQLTDLTGLQSDECEIRLDDRDDRIAFPRKGALMRISLGWEGQGLSFMGNYTVDEIEFSGPPLTLVIRGKQAEMAGLAKNPRQHAWENVSLSQIIHEVAARNPWQAVCSITTTVPRADQVGESDLNFLTRLARQYNATATLKDRKLVVLPRADGKTASDKRLPVISLSPTEETSYRLTFLDRGSVGAVKTQAHDTKTGKKIDIVIPNPDAPAGSSSATHTDRHIYPNPSATKAAAKAKLADMNRRTASGQLELRGRADLAAEKSVELQGFKQEVDGIYLIESVTHQLAGQS
jgi:phage protein D